MKVRAAEMKDLKSIMKLMNDGKKYMSENQTDPQWKSDYPNEEVILKDINSGGSFVAEVEGKIVATFALSYGYDPVYDTLTEGKWLT